MRGEESLCGTLGFEPLLISFPTSEGQVTVLRPIVLAHAAGAVLVQNPELSQCGATGRQFVRRDRFRTNALVLQKPAQGLSGISCVGQAVEHS